MLHFVVLHLLIKKGSKEVDSSIEVLELTQRIGVTFSISEGASSFSCLESLVNPACCHIGRELLPPSSPISRTRHLRDTYISHHNTILPTLIWNYSLHSSVVLLKMFVGLLIQLPNVQKTKIPPHLCNHSPITERLHTQILMEIHVDINVAHNFTTIFMQTLSYKYTFHIS